MPQEEAGLSEVQAQMLAVLDRLGAHDAGLSVSTKQAAREAGRSVTVAGHALHVLRRLDLAGWAAAPGGRSDYWLTTAGLELARSRKTGQETGHG
jgi:hypothetical protein